MEVTDYLAPGYSFVPGLNPGDDSSQDYSHDGISWIS